MLEDDASFFEIDDVVTEDPTPDPIEERLTAAEARAAQAEAKAEAANRRLEETAALLSGKKPASPDAYKELLEKDPVKALDQRTAQIEAEARAERWASITDDVYSEFKEKHPDLLDYEDEIAPHVLKAQKAQEKAGVNPFTKTALRDAYKTGIETFSKKFPSLVKAANEGTPQPNHALKLAGTPKGAATGQKSVADMTEAEFDAYWSKASRQHT